MAEVTDTRTGEARTIRSWYDWVRRNHLRILLEGLVEVVEQEDGGAAVRIEAPYSGCDTLTLRMTWGSYQVATRYFGKTTRILRGVRLLFVNRHGEVLKDTTGAKPLWTAP